MALNMTELAKVQISAEVTGTAQVTALTTAMSSAEATTQKLTRSQQGFVNQLGTLKAKLEEGEVGALKYKAGLLGISAAVNPTIEELASLGLGAEHAGHSFRELALSGGIVREMIVLLHESLIMGNWSRFGGSMMVIAERAHLTEWALTALGGAALGGAAGVAALVAALVMGERESTRFANSMSLTGGMAGITEQQFRNMAATIGDDVPGAATKGRNALMDLIATGQFSGDTLLAVARAATEMATFSGQYAADVVKNFDDMKGNAADWAVKMNASYHFLSEAQYEYIQRLQQQGQTEAAEQAAANDLFQSLADNGTHNLGILEQAWNDVTGAVRGTFNAMMDIGRAQTLEDQLATAIGNDQRGGKGRPGRDPNSDPQVIALRKQIADANAAAAKKSLDDQIQQLGISANQHLKTLTAGLLPGPTEIANFTSDLKTSIAEVLKADPHSQYGLMMQSMEPELIAKFTKDRAGGATGKINTPDANGFVIPGDDSARLQTQLTLMQQYASATHMSESAVLSLSISQGKLNGFTDAQIAELKKRAAADDQLAAARAAASAEQKYTDTMGGLQDQKSDLAAQIAQMTQFGSVTKSAELSMINLQIAQGKLDGVPQSELDSLKATATDIDQLNAKLIAYGRSAAGGTKQAFAAYVDQATDAGAQIKGVWNDVFTGMNDMLVAALTGGKFNFDKFALSVVDDMLKMEIQTQILGPMLAKLGSLGSGAGAGGAPGWWGILEPILGAALGGGLGGAVGGGGGSYGQGLDIGNAGPIIPNAMGGIMTSRGPVPLNRYAMGGVANTPQVAMFGEGSGPEAYVPLPDGRSIPVSMKGGQGGGTVINNHFNINSDGSTSGGDSVKNAQSMQRAIVYAIQQELIRQHRDGGIFSSTANA